MNAWTDRARMIESRESASACLFETSMMVFVFGGSNLLNEQMDTIEQYDIDHNKWRLLEVKIMHPVSSFVTHALGKDKVLIMGTHNRTMTNQETGESAVEQLPVKQIMDLSAQC